MYKNNTRKVNNFLPDILINEESKDKLFSYASSHNFSELEEFITTNSISLEVKNNNNQSITHVLLLGESTIDENELLRCIKFLVERGAPISIIDNSNLTPLFICIKKNYPKIFKYLLEEGASLDINTYDNLTVLHEIVKPEYTTYDANGIQSIIPDKLPKITMEGYETVYKEILDAIEKKLENNADPLRTDFDKFKTIAKQFYYSDDNDEKEDFNNILLEEEASNNPSIKDDLFKKLKNQLEIFYSSDKIEDVDETKLKRELNTIKDKLNEQTKKQTMLDLNTNVLNAIKSLAYSLELRTHFFFVDELGRSHVATDVVIAIATSVVNLAILTGRGEAIALGACTTQQFIIAIRAAIQAVEAVNTVLVVEKKYKSEINEAIINIIKDNVVEHLTTHLAPNPITVSAALGTAAVQTAVQRAIVPNAIGAAVAPANAKAQELINAVQAKINTGNLLPLETNIQAAVNNGVVNGRIVLVANQASIAVTNVSNILTRARNTNQAVDAAVARAYRVAAKAAVQAAIRATAYAIVYLRIQGHAVLGVNIPSIPAIMTAVNAAVQTAVLPAVSEEDQIALQAALKDPVVAVEAVLAAAQKASVAILATGAPPNNIVLAAIKEALENVDELVRSHIATDVVIAIATRVVNTAVAAGAARAVNTTFSDVKTNAIRAAIQAVEAATTADGTNQEIINFIKESVVAHITATAASDANSVHGALTAPGVVPAVQAAMVPNGGATALAAALPKANAVIAAVQAAINIAGTTQLEVNIQTAVNDPAVDAEIVPVQLEVSSICSNVARVQSETDTAYQNLPAADRVPGKAAVQTAIRAATYARVYINNQINPAIMSAVHAAVQTAVLTAVSAEEQTRLKTALKDPIVAVEAVLAAAQKASAAILAARAPDGGVVLAAIKETLALPQIIPDIFKNQDYNELIKSYKLMNIPQQYFNYNISYQYNNSFVSSLDNNLVKYIENNTKPTGPLINYKLPDGNRTHTIDFFNLLHTFNEYARNNYNPQVIDDDIFILYQNIQQIYKYNYIIYIFQKQKDRILQFKDHVVRIYTALKTNLDTVFDSNLQELEKSINFIKQKLKEIEKIANEYIDIYNKINGFQKYKKDTDVTVTKYIGIYPKIQIPEISESTDFTTLQEEYAIIAGCNNYSEYDKHKNSFFHNLVLYFQDIGVYDNVIALPFPTLNRIPKLMYYNIDIIVNHNTNDDDNKNKAYKLYFYDPIYLKLEKQRIIDTLLADQDISNIDITKFDTYKNEIATKLKDVIKNKILNEILEEKFNNILVLEINNFFKEKLTNNTDELTYDIQIKEPDLNAILLGSIGFSNILIPNYEFKNNKFLSISKNKNKFLDLTLYFDTNYFKINNLKTLKYYKKNEFINELLNNNESLLGKMDNKDWTPIYYAIDGNNYEVIAKILNVNKDKDILMHYDYKKISPLKLCINKQLNHLNYLLTDDDEIHYLENYIKMLRNELQSNNLLIPLNIDAVFIIALFIQNLIWLEKATDINLKKLNNSNTRKTQINEEYNNMKRKTYDVNNNDVNNNDFKYNDSDVKNTTGKPYINYKKQENTNYNYNDEDNNKVLNKYYKKAKILETNNFGSYGSYWKNYDKHKNNKKNILEHINKSKEFKNILKDYREEKDDNFNAPKYNDKKALNELKQKLTPIKDKLERYLKFINIRFNSNKDNAYTVYLNKIYVHVLSNIIGVDFYLTMEELIVKHYISLNVDIDQDTIKNQLQKFNNLLINNKLDESNINYKYIIATKNPELTLKKDIIDILKIELIPSNEELIATFETVVFPRYRELYKITYKYLQMFISNYHKFIYNQYHGLEILLLLLEKISS
jgi:hypothetical protein